MHQRWLDHMLDAFGRAAIQAAHPRPGDHILDIGCGAGTTSFALARELAGNAAATGHVTGIDISVPLIEQARKSPDNDGKVDFMLADASQAKLTLQHYDLLYSRFGVMFFEDAVAAFRHLRKALRPTGRMAFTCWRTAEENDWVRVPMGAIRDLIPPAPPPSPDAPGPFSLGDKAKLMHILHEAGFADIHFQPFDHDIIFGRGENSDAAIDDALHMAFELGPLSRALADTDDDIRQRAAQAVRAAFAKKATDNHVIINGAAWIVTARNQLHQGRKRPISLAPVPLRPMRG